MLSPEDTTALYRWYDIDGQLLYIGISYDAVRRSYEHQRQSPWFREVARSEVEHFSTRTAALEAEREAITRECPKYNTQHVRNKLGNLPPVMEELSKYIRVKRFTELTGWTERAVYCKVSKGVWLEGKEYRKAPDGSTLIDLEGYDRWVRGERVLA